MLEKKGGKTIWLKVLFAILPEGTAERLLTPSRTGGNVITAIDGGLFDISVLLFKHEAENNRQNGYLFPEQEYVLKGIKVMKKKWEKIIAFVLVACLVATLLPMGQERVKGADADSISLGANVYHYDETNDFEWYSFDNATGTKKDNNPTLYKGLIIIFTMVSETDPSYVILPGDKVSKPKVPIVPSAIDGFTKSNKSIGYSTIVDISKKDGESGETVGRTADEVANFISKIMFVNADNQKVQISVSENTITDPYFYFDETQHYYQYVEDKNQSMTWTEAYKKAEEHTFLGRTGYLATPVTLAEDLYLKTASSTVGWLGGTRLKHGAVSSDNMHYESFDKNDAETYWYWACGPEMFEMDEDGNFILDSSGNKKERKFFDTAYVSGESESYEEVYRRNAKDNGYYFNWRVTAGTGDKEPNNGNNAYADKTKLTETCLATLIREADKDLGYQAKYAGQADFEYYSWNDNPETNNQYDGFKASGYFIEYGDKPVGNSTTPSGVTNDIIQSVTIKPADSQPIETETLKDNVKCTYTYGDTNCRLDVSNFAEGVTNPVVSFSRDAIYSDILDVDSSTGALTIKKAGTAVVTVKVKPATVDGKQYRRTVVDVLITINKAVLTITPKDSICSKKAGANDPSFTNSYYDVNGYKKQDNSNLLKVDGKDPKLTRESGEAVGEYAFTLDNFPKVLDNYTLVLADKKFKINPTKTFDNISWNPSIIHEK